MDYTREHVIETLQQIGRRHANAPNLVSPTFRALPSAGQQPDPGIVLSYIESLERKIAHLQAQDEPIVDGTAEQINCERTLKFPLPELDIASTLGALQNGSCSVDAKRFKKLNYRYGPAEIYEDSDTMEAVRARDLSARDGGYVLNVYREYDWEGHGLNSKLEICSIPLLKLVRDLIDYYPGPEFDLLRWETTVGDTVTFSEPYMMLFTYRSKISDSIQRSDVLEETKSHVHSLLRVLREEMPTTSAKLDEIESGTCKRISFQDLWLLYAPNTPVYVSTNGEDRQMVVSSRRIPEKNQKGQWDALTLYCWSTRYKGERLCREFCTWKIRPFTGEKAIEHLELVPTKYLPNQEAIRSRLLNRGRQYYKLNQGSTLREYYGDRFPRILKDVSHRIRAEGFIPVSYGLKLHLHLATGFDRDLRTLQEPIRVVIDQRTYWEKHNLGTYKCEDMSDDFELPVGEDALEDKDGKPLESALVCCDPQVGVFSLRDKEWGSVRVDDLQPVRFRDKAFKKLVIKDEYKKLIIAMVQSFMLEEPGFSDIIGGKGRGLTILLHGPPGTGKTLTAEAIAERQSRPLYSVTCGDLGTEPVELERRLKEAFSYAMAWKAILLMDEADIFLQERDVHNVNRNALVSIFLRELSYFDGILFLTTNRPGDIDEAFQSRIHISIGLKALDTVERRKVWAVFIKDAELSDKEKAALLEHVTENFDSDRLNGRQIRNTIRTALALAQLKKERINADHLDRVVKMGREFSSYMEDLNKMNAEDYAIALGRRAPARSKDTRREGDD